VGWGGLLQNLTLSEPEKKRAQRLPTIGPRGYRSRGRLPIRGYI